MKSVRALVVLVVVALGGWLAFEFPEPPTPEGLQEAAQPSSDEPGKIPSEDGTRAPEPNVTREEDEPRTAPQTPTDPDATWVVLGRTTRGIQERSLASRFSSSSLPTRR